MKVCSVISTFTVNYCTGVVLQLYSSHQLIFLLVEVVILRLGLNLLEFHN